MKLGDTRSDAAIEIVAPHAFTTGRYSFRHPRCGKVELERREQVPGPPSPEKAFHWVVVHIDRPDE